MQALDFKNPDYSVVFRERAQRLKNIRANPGGILPGLKEHYKTNPVDFINDWGMTFDPRNAEIGMPVTIPFVLFKRQEEYITWLYERWKGREDGLVEKSRDMGVSWLCVAFGVWMWLFHPGTVVGFGSRKEEYVDKIGDPKCLFWKIRRFVELLPKEFWPQGYDPKANAPHMRVLNPENSASIVGEAGDNIGRGNRASLYFVDEAAFLERADTVDAALSMTSNCKIHVSTPNGNGNAFYRKRHGGKIPVFVFDWTEDPRKDQAWYDKMKDTLDPVVLAQEVDRDYSASTQDAWINNDIVAAAQRVGPADVEAIGEWRIGVDAAHQGNDESIIHRRRGRLNLPQIAHRGSDGTQLAAAVTEACDDLVASGGTIGIIVIELDGPGVSCYDRLKSGRYSDKVHGVHTGARLKDERNFNIRAKMWRDARDYLNEPPVCLDDDPEIRAQLTSLKYRYKDGLLLMQDKKEYKSMFGRSPDRADAFVLTFVEAALNKKTDLRAIYNKR